MKKKRFLKDVLIFSLGVLCSVSTIYATSLYSAEEVSYDNTISGSANTTVQGAIDDLYERANGIQKRTLKKLGEVTTSTKNNATLTFNVKSVDSDYAKYTVEDFVDTASHYYLKYGDCIFRVDSSTWSYNSSTGVLTISLTSSHNYIETVSYTISIYVLAYS